MAVNTNHGCAACVAIWRGADPVASIPEATASFSYLGASVMRAQSGLGFRRSLPGGRHLTNRFRRKNISHYRFHLSGAVTGVRGRSERRRSAGEQGKRA